MTDDRLCNRDLFELWLEECYSPDGFVVDKTHEIRYETNTALPHPIICTICLGWLLLLPAQPAFAATTQLTWLDSACGYHVISSGNCSQIWQFPQDFVPTKITKPNGGTTQVTWRHLRVVRLVFS